MGLVFLLFGPPGVGKTLTAEATCEYLKKPLYNISVCDLGINPENMQIIMDKIIEYVDRWDAIMLIDEVDIFVEERQFAHVTRNALVSTFLKFLEYNNGIIFLTTNRLNTIDSAVRSRINVFVCYKKLDYKVRKNIWISLLKKWDIELKKATVNTLAKSELNGREMRNYMRLIISIHKDRKLELTDESILKIFDEYNELTDEFNKSFAASMYT